MHARTGGTGRVSSAGDAAGVRRAGGGVRRRAAREAEQETAAAVRAELGSTVLWEQLARRIGSDATVQSGPRAFRGSTVASYPEFLVLRATDGSEHLIRYGPAVSVALPAEPPQLRPTPDGGPPAATSSRWRSASSPGGGSPWGYC